MSAVSAIIAASMLRFVDPYTSAYQTDDPREGASLSAEKGYWPVPCGLKDPLAGKPSPRVVHCVFRVGDEPLPGYSPDAPTPLIKVNQVGYLPDAPKFAYAGMWLGPVFGAWRPRSPMTSWQVVSADSGQVVFESPAPPVLRVRDGFTKEGVPFTGEETYEMDFSDLRTEGRYFIRIPGVGRSETFRVAAGAAEDAFRVHMGGLYQKRCGIAKTEPYTHWTAGACHESVVRGVFAPEEGSLEPLVKWFEIIKDNTDWDGPKIRAPGGWHDAADYDRRPAHLNIVNDLCAVYLMRPGNFSDGQLALPENSNGIPDILDEAEWGLRHLLAGQCEDGGVGTWFETTGHPGPGNVAERDPMKYAVSRPTRRSSLAYAAHAALLARCHPAFREKYLESAKRAWSYAVTSSQANEIYELRHGSAGSEVVYWTEDRVLPAEFLLKAAINLSALTDDDSYISIALGDGAYRPDVPSVGEALSKNSWKAIPLLFAGERALGFPTRVARMLAKWEKSKLNAAKGALEQLEKSYAYRTPWWPPQKGWVNAMGMGHSHPLVRAQLFVLAHFITGDRRYLGAASLANDFHCGCNPQGATLTSGLGRVYPVAFLDLPSYVDGLAEPVPGITPYRWTYALPAKVVEMVFGGDRKKASKWPIWRRWGNLEGQTVGASEYTVWETIAPAASVTGYLLTPSGAPPTPRPPPADDISTLPGYWMLP